MVIVKKCNQCCGKGIHWPCMTGPYSSAWFEYEICDCVFGKLVSICDENTGLRDKIAKFCECVGISLGPYDASKLANLMVVRQASRVQLILNYLKEKGVVEFVD